MHSIIEVPFPSTLQLYSFINDPFTQEITSREEGQTSHNCLAVPNKKKGKWENVCVLGRGRGEGGAGGVKGGHQLDSWMTEFYQYHEMKSVSALIIDRTADILQPLLCSDLLQTLPCLYILHKQLQPDIPDWAANSRG